MFFNIKICNQIYEKVSEEVYSNGSIQIKAEEFEF